MASDDVTTKLVVSGGNEYIRTLTDAALAQSRFIEVLRTAGTVQGLDINQDIVQTAASLRIAKDEALEFSKNLKSAFTDAGIKTGSVQITNLIKSQTAAFLEAAQAAEREAAAIAKLDATRATQRTSNLAETPQIPTRSATTGRFINPSSDESISQNIRAQQTAFLSKQAAIEDQIESRRIEAQKLREQQREKTYQQEIAALEQRNQRSQLLQTAQLNAERTLANREAEIAKEAQRQKTLAANTPNNTPQSRATEANFARQNPLIANGPDRVALGVEEQDKAFQKASSSGAQYLFRLSQIHAGTGLLLGSNNAYLNNLLTLGFTFGSVGQQAGTFNTKLGLAGVTIGAAVSAVSNVVQFVGSSVGLVINLVEQGLDTLVKFGVTGAAALLAVGAASVKLAGGVEDVFAEIIAFGQPSGEQLTTLETKVSNLARTFGTSAADISAGASLFIRAGGDIETAINGGTEAVVLLQKASRGELVPSTAARSIVTITNAFKEFDVTASQAADVIVGTAQKTALSFNEVTQAFQQAGPTAALLRVPLTDLASIIGVLANNGLRGQVAGTGLKQVLLDLLNPSQQARQKLQEYGVSIVDAQGKIRPLRDVLIDMNKAFGDSGKAQGEAADAARIQALAAIFGSRANLAAAIIARTGAGDFDKLKTAIEGVTAVGVVEILNSTTSAQLGIFKTNVEELARAFGGPLNVAIGTIIRSGNDLLQTFDRSKFAAAGQAIIAVVTGQGFGPIKQILDDIENEGARNFFTGLLNSALTVRNAIVNQFVPAVQLAITNIQNAFGDVDSHGLDGITNAIVNIISAGSRLTVFTSQLIADFISGNERGQEIKRTIDGLAASILGALTTAFVSVTASIITGVIVLQLFGQGLLAVLRTASAFQQVTKDTQLDILSKQFNSAEKSMRDADTELSRISVRLGDITKQQNALSVRSDFESLPIQNELDNLDQEQAALLRRREALKQNNVQADQTRTEASKEYYQLKQNLTLGEQFDQLQSTFSPANIENFLSGDLPQQFSNISDQIKQITDAFNRGAPEQDQETSGAFFPDPNKQKKIANDIARIARDANQEFLDVQEDTQTKQVQLQLQTFNKLLDLTTTYNKNKEKLEEETNNRIDESRSEFNQQRSDRDRLQSFSRSLDLENFLRDQSNAQRDLAIGQEDAADDRRNQRRVQDTDNVLSKIEDREQHSEDIKNQIADRGFQRRQQDEERAFGRQQSRASTQFDRNLDAQAKARENAQRLLEAKTPEDRINVQKTIAQQRLDLAFSQQQEEQRRRFSEGQDDARVKFSREQEDSAFQRSIKNEEALFKFKVGLEIKYRAIRRALEDTEINRENGTALDRLLRSQGFSKKDFDFRLLQSDKLQGEQDKIADEGQGRQEDKQRREQTRRQTEADREFSTSIFSLFDDAGRQQATNTDAAVRRAREISERATKQLVDLQEREGPQQGARTALTQIQLDLANTDLLFLKAKQDAQTFFDVIKDATLEGQGTPIDAPRRSIQLSIPPLNNIHVDLTPEAIQELRDSQAQAGDRNVTVLGNVLGDADFLNQIKQFLLIGR